MPKEFPKFMLLPGELRTMIWKYALPEPRVYEVMDVPSAKTKMKPTEGLMFANVHHEPPPSLAAVCRESRGIVLFHYKKLTFGLTTKYIDLSRDLLLLEPYLQLRRLHRTLNFLSRIPLVQENMTGLALGTSYGVNVGICHPVVSWTASNKNMSKLLTALAEFPELKSLLFVVHQEFQFEFDDFLPPNTAAARGEPQHSPMSTHPAHPPPGPGVYSTHSYPVDMLSLQPSLSQQSFSSSSSSLSSATPSPIMQQRSLPSIPPPPAFPPVVHHAQATPAPQPAAPQALRSQVVHQAYRFGFDIESNINHQPRRPHLNQLLFYPLQNNRDGAPHEEDWETLLNANTNEHNADYEDDAMGSNLFPRNDEWSRFIQTFQRKAVAAIHESVAKGNGQSPLCVDKTAIETSQTDLYAFGPARSNGSGNGLSSTTDKKHNQKCVGNNNHSGSSYGGSYSYNNFRSLHGGNYSGVRKNTTARNQQPRYTLKHKLPSIKGVSLLWRYTR
ncbi:hypothetical protein SEUCBS139899_001322 [Sporothrix eucalyptigena]|uniref:2EXR domain-containing protein n=1 Tax=Sporothrix eucalyptigena TaxID=1812306 RepID=A0ABP0CL14_9PEZI